MPQLEVLGRTLRILHGTDAGTAFTKAKEKIPESGDIAISSLFLKEKKNDVIDLINFYRMQVD